MNRKLLTFTLTLLALSVAMTPATAKPVGPQKAVDKNPNLEYVEPSDEPVPNDGGVDAFLPSGGVVSWMANTEDMGIDISRMLDARAAKGLMNSAEKIDTVEELMAWMMALLDEPLTLENKWFYIPYDILAFIDPAGAALWPEGIYLRFVNVGPTWDA